MLQFIIMTLSFTVGYLLAIFIMVAIMMNKKVMKAYLKWCNKMTKIMVDEAFDENEEES